MDASDILKDRAVRAYPSGGPALSRGSAAGVGVSGVPAAAASGGAADPTGFRRQLTALRQGEPSGAGSSQRAGSEGGVGAGPAADAARITVRRGDTLTSLVRAQWKAQGQAPEALSAHEAHRRALQMARANGLPNPDLILVGQQLNWMPQAQATAAAKPSSNGVASRPSGPLAPQAWSTVPSLPSTAVTQAERVESIMAAKPLAHPLMSQTLQRAVDLGYLPAADRQRVGLRIESLADKHGFTPDDFAKAVLMESDGLNPRASNGRCHGIIQFCAGPDRGAASAGYGQRPQDILGLTVLQQLELVDRYFDDTRLKDFRGRDGQVRLDDLYLTILTPVARQERSPTAPLPIAGQQALDLHVGRERSAPITRASILAGLNVNARARLGQFVVAQWHDR